MDVTIAGRGTFYLEHLVLDVNGTVASGGHLIEGVRDQLVVLQQSGWHIHWITADTRGRQADLDEELGWPAVRISARDPRERQNRKRSLCGIWMHVTS